MSQRETAIFRPACMPYIYGIVDLFIATLLPYMEDFLDSGAAYWYILWTNSRMASNVGSGQFSASAFCHDSAAHHNDKILIPC